MPIRKTSAKVTKYKEGTYQNLTVNDWPRKFKCTKCGKPCTLVWDTIVASGRWSFCSGGCLYAFLMDRHLRSEIEKKTCLLAEDLELLIPGSKVTTITAEEHRKEQDQQNYEIKMLKEYETKYLGKKWD